MRTLYTLVAIQLLCIGALAFHMRKIENHTRQSQDTLLSLSKRNELLLSELNFTVEQRFDCQQLPHALARLPKADEQGIVLSIKTISIPSAIVPYNASLIAQESGYQLFFRYDLPLAGKSKVPFYSHIGYVKLDHNFDLREPQLHTIETHSNFSEDPRVFQNGERCFLVFNDVIANGNRPRSMWMGELDEEQKVLNSIRTLAPNPTRTEKNWSPFVYEGEPYFVYSINPHQILKYPSMLPMNLGSESMLSDLDWPSNIWGVLRGGTPAQLVDGEYLAFFHSAFGDRKGIGWYVMGAYTFEATPPFRITSISPYPILFKDIYNSPLQNTANPRIRCLYPAGFVCDQGLIHVSCGENDSAVKIITMDKKALLNSLKRVGGH